MGIPYLNDLYFLFLEFLGAAAHTVFLNIFISLKVLEKYFRTSYLQSEAVNELKANFICQEATPVSLNQYTA